MIKEYYWKLEGETIRKTITQDRSAQDVIEKELADFRETTEILDFHSIKARTVFVLSSELTIGNSTI